METETSNFVGGWR